MERRRWWREGGDREEVDGERNVMEERGRGWRKR